MAPLTSGGQVRGRISLQNLDHTHAFSEADERLLGTIAASLSVALDNARLFDETKRLPDRDGRTEPPSWPSSTAYQQGLAAELDLQLDVRPRRRQGPGDLRRAGRRHRDLRPRVGAKASYPYWIERGVRIPDEHVPIDDE